MAETFYNLALIYIAIILSGAGYYYLSKAIASRKQRVENENPVNQTTIIAEPTTITAHQNNSAPVSITIEKEITPVTKAIEKTDEPGIKIPHSPDPIAPVIEKNNTAIIHQQKETYTNVIPVSTIIENEVAEAIQPIDKIADAEIAIQHSPDLIAPVIEKDNVTSNQPNETYTEIVPVSTTIEDEIAEPIHSINKIADAEIAIQHYPDSIPLINVKGNTTINQQNEVYKPQLTLVKQNTQAGKRMNAGLIKTIYYFGCEDGYSIINPTIEITFKNKFADISGGITGAGIVVTRYLSKQSFDNNTRFIITTDLLKPYNYIFIQTINRQELQIEKLEIIA